MEFAFEKLEVYQRSLKFISVIDNLLERSGERIGRSLADQLTRACMSIPLNIAEGNGRWHKGDKRQFFWIARGSVFECIPLIELLSMKGIITFEERDSRRAKLQILGKMLTRLVQSHGE